MDEVILVDKSDNAVGVMEKMKAHREGKLHRAFSVFIFNPAGQMLLQRRAKHKYHSPGLWTNTCCSHPRPGEHTAAAANRRLMEEMGIAAKLEPRGHFIYKCAFDNGLTEYEYDHVFTGVVETDPVINRQEVEDYKWMAPREIKKMIIDTPGLFTTWFKIAMEKSFVGFPDSIG